MKATGTFVTGEFYAVVALFVLLFRNLELFFLAKIHTQTAALTIFIVYNYLECGFGVRNGHYVVHGFPCHRIDKGAFRLIGDPERVALRYYVMILLICL